MSCVSPGSYEGWEGSSFPCIRVRKNRDTLPRSVLLVISGSVIHKRSHRLRLMMVSCLLSGNTQDTTDGKADFLHHSFSSLIISFPHVFVNRISVRVRGGEAQGPAAGLSGMNPGLIRDLGATFFESHCEFNDKTSSPFSSNRTMFETEEVC